MGVEVLLVVVLLVFALAMIAAPLRPGRAAAREAAERADLDALEAARDEKYREIREAELDFRTGKLSEGDWRAQDRTLRREAVEILRRIDALGEPEA
jgi:type II secretory pathway pseudopilin PulG